jgi:hypothetical protein
VVLCGLLSEDVGPGKHRIGVERAYCIQPFGVHKGVGESHVTWSRGVERCRRRLQVGEGAVYDVSVGNTVELPPGWRVSR